MANPTRVRINNALFNSGFPTSCTLDTTNVAEGNLLIGLVASSTDTAGTVFDTPSGWTKVGEVGNSGANSCQCKLGVYRKIAGASESDPTINSSGASNRIITSLIEYSGIDPTTPIHLTPVFAETESGSQATLVAASLTTTVEDCVVIAPFTISSPADAPFGISGTDWSEIIDEQTGTGTFEAQLVVGEKLMSGTGASGDCTMTPTSNCEGAWVQIAIAPATGTVSTIGISETETLYDINIVQTQQLTSISEQEILNAPVSDVLGTVSSKVHDEETLYTVQGLVTEGLSASEQETLYGATQQITLVLLGGEENERLYDVSVVQVGSLPIPVIHENESLYDLSAHLISSIGTLSENETLSAVSISTGETIVVTNISEQETLYSITPVLQFTSVSVINETERLYSMLGQGWILPPPNIEGTRQDQLLAFYLLNGAVTNSLKQAESEFLVAQGSTQNKPLQDMWREFWDNQSISNPDHMGALYQFLVDQGQTQATMIDAMHDWLNT